MTITFHYPGSGHTRTHRGLTQAHINQMITSLSVMNEDTYIPVQITVTEDNVVRCQTCGEEAGSTGSMSGLVHKYGPVGHPFVPNKGITH